MTAKEPARTIVVFKTDQFNSSESKDYFINPGCFGDDLAKWLKEELSKRGHDCPEDPGQEDFGWYLNFAINNEPFCAVIGFRPIDDSGDGEWIIELERICGFFASIFGQRKKNISPQVSQQIHQVLTENSRISAISWHWRHQFEKGQQDDGSPIPLSGDI